MGKFSYKSKYGIVVIVADEEEQKRVYEQLSRMGLKCKVVCV
jgi:hypothetical protein